MEAPEIVWINKDRGVWFQDPKQASFSEYVRKDAFVEKAEKYLTEKFIKDVSVIAGGIVNINFSAAIKNFVKCMKGE